MVSGPLFLDEKQYRYKISNNTSNKTISLELVTCRVRLFCPLERQKRLCIISLQNASPTAPLPQRAPLYRCHGAS
jgi:hypothetical protein